MREYWNSSYSFTENAYNFSIDVQYLTTVQHLLKNRTELILDWYWGTESSYSTIITIYTLKKQQQWKRWI